MPLRSPEMDMWETQVVEGRPGLWHQQVICLMTTTRLMRLRRTQEQRAVHLFQPTIQTRPTLVHRHHSSNRLSNLNTNRMAQNRIMVLFHLNSRNMVVSRSMVRSLSTAFNNPPTAPTRHWCEYVQSIASLNQSAVYMVVFSV